MTDDEMRERIEASLREQAKLVQEIPIEYVSSLAEVEYWRLVGKGYKPRFVELVMHAYRMRLITELGTDFVPPSERGESPWLQ